MAEFEKLQALWQQQPERGTAILDAVNLTRALGKYGRRQRWINTAKLAMMLILIPWVFVHSRSNLWVVFGFAVVLIPVALLVAIDWRNQRAVSRLNFAEPSSAFVRNAIDQLLEHREPFRRHFWFVLISLIAGLNLMAMGLAGQASMTWRLVWHAVATGFPFLAYYGGALVRIKRFEFECRSLVDRLRAMQEVLEEQSE